MMNYAGIRLLCLVGRRNIDQMNHRLALAVHPGAGKREIRPSPFFKTQDVLIEPNGIGEPAGPDIEMIKHAYAHAHMISLPFCFETRLLHHASIKPCPPAKWRRCRYLGQCSQAAGEGGAGFSSTKSQSTVPLTIMPGSSMRRQNPGLHKWLKSLFSVSASWASPWQDISSSRAATR